MATQTTSVNLPDFIQDPLKKLLADAGKLRKERYIPYGEPRIAGFNPMQNQAFGLAQKTTGVQTPFLKQALGMTNEFSRRIDEKDIERYSNPYHQQVTSNVLRELNRENQIAADADRARVGQLNAFGNERVGLVESERERNFGQLMSDVLAQRNEAAYNSALGAATSEKTLGMAGASQLGSLGTDLQDAHGKDIQTLLGLGTVQQGQTQDNLDLAHGDFLEQRQYPYGQINWFMNLLNGNPGTQSVTSSTNTKSGNKTAGILGTILGLGGILGGSGGGEGGGGFFSDIFNSIF